MSDGEIAQIPEELDAYFYDTMDWGWTTDEEYALMAKLKKGKAKAEGKEAEKDKSKVFSIDDAKKTLSSNITANVGKGQKNEKNDVIRVAKGLTENGYTVSENSLKEGLCDETLIKAIKKFEREKLGITSKRLQGYLTPQSWTGDYKVIFGKNPKKLNNSISVWGRVSNYNSKTNKSNYTINNSNFLDREEYDKEVDIIALNSGIAKNSDDEKSLQIAANAASNNEYFEKITKDINLKLILFNEIYESHQVNPVLKERLSRFHKFLSAVGMFKIDMEGRACRSEKKAHIWAIQHVVLGGKKATSASHIKENLIKIYNDETVDGGKKDASSNIKDSDGNIWAKKEHFITDKDGKATDIDKTLWHKHIKSFGTRTYSVLTAEGYNRGDKRRFPLSPNDSPGRSKHITGDAIDINTKGFINRNDTKIDIIALYFGLSRPVPGEQWHFEVTNLQLSSSEKKKTEKTNRNNIKQ
jgi:hypothetical protein